MQVEALELLEHALQFSQHNFQIRLLLMRLYTHPAIAAVAAAVEVAKPIRIKQIMLESSGHLLLRLLFAASAKCLECMRRHRRHRRCALLPASHPHSLFRSCLYTAEDNFFKKFS